MIKEAEKSEAESKYIHGGINKNTYEMLFADKTVNETEMQGIEQLRAFDTINEYTKQQKGIFGNLLKHARIVYDKKTKEYKYSHNGLEYTFDMISRYVVDPKIRKELLSDDRCCKCNRGSIILSDILKGSTIVTGHIIVGNHRILHTIVLGENMVLGGVQKKGEWVFDWTLNLIMPLNQYEDMVNFHKVNEFDGENIRSDLETLAGLSFDTKTYLAFEEELMDGTKRNEGMFRRMK